MTRDMTKEQFKSACKRRGFRPANFGGGYYELGDGLQVFIHNAGPIRRQQLAYLIKQKERFLRKPT